MLELIKETIDTPNFSIILPGKCNANCNFCFWERSETESPMYCQQLAWYLDLLGEKITQISITGGEPTMSPLFDKTMKILKTRENLKVVLTSNGALLKCKFQVMSGVVRHINISRHALDDAENYNIFNTDSVPDTEELIELCGKANTLNIDVTLNKVVTHQYNNVGEFYQYIDYVKKIGASALTIRKDYSCNALEMVPLEIDLSQKIKSTRKSCPVCVTNSYLIKGVPVHFKYSLKEPSETIPCIYEFVYQPNGSLTEDWGGKKGIGFRETSPINPMIARSKCSEMNDRSGGCGWTGPGC